MNAKSENMKYDVCIIGAGPAGYIAAIRAGQLGMKVLLADRESIGGMCIHWGCIPTKALLESARQYYKLNQIADFGVEGIKLDKIRFNWTKAVDRAMQIAKKMQADVEFLLHKKAVEFEQGNAVITGKNTVSINNRLIEARNIIIATGSLPELSKSKSVTGIRALYKMEELPQEMAIEGNGPVAAEMAQLLNMLGVKVYLNTHSQMLIPGADHFLNQHLSQQLRSEGIKMLDNNDIPPHVIRLNANLRKAVVPDNHVEIALDTNGFIAVDQQLMTNVPGIYAVGDVNGISQFAHASSAQGMFAINHIKGVKGHMRHDRYPMNIYTMPEIAQVGKTEQELHDAGVDYKINEFKLSANAKAMIKNETQGLVRILSDKKYGEVLGVQIIAENATDMIAEASAYIEMEATVFDVARTIHAHPTLSEVFSELGLAAADAVKK